MVKRMTFKQFVFILPLLLFICVFSFYPIVTSFMYSLFDLIVNIQECNCSLLLPPNFHQPKRLLRGIRKILPGTFRLHGILQGNDPPQDRKKRVNPISVALPGILCDASRKSDHRDPILFCQPGHAYGSLSHGCLAVQSSLPGHDHIGVL